MVSQTNEQALENCIETALVEGARYEKGDPADFDREFAIDRDKFWRFLETTQPEELAKVQDQPNWQRIILERFHRKVKKDGILSVLKKGIAINDADFTLLYSLPYNDANDTVRDNFERNIFSVTRQVHYSESDPGLSIDMVLFVNGMAIATMELKNPWSGQTVYHAKKQYCQDRDPKETLLNFGRCLVHFAVDPDEVWMTTKLDQDKTYFLPFNKGFNYGKGNPPNPNGHKTAYLWEDVLTRTSLTTIIEHFVLLEGDKKAPLAKKTLIFPRYHQRDVVRQLLGHAKAHGPGQKYLIQHSAGSGKSNSITWTAYQLIQLYADRSDRPVFDSVVVVTDRRILDKQLRDNIKDFSEVKNIVAPAFKSSDLKEALEQGKKIIITTIQKFPFIVEGIEDMSGKNFAVIIDEAHSSQSGQAADKMNMALGSDDDEPEDNQDRILKVMAGRKMNRNASFFAFTATPKNTTLEKFGQPTAVGGFEPFHLYSMKQAIEEGFILDVLANYTTYRSYYEIQKSIEDNPEFETARAQKKLKAYVEGHQQTIGTKADIMVNHFLEKVVGPKKLKGKARGMVVTRNIEAAIRYFFAIRDALTAANAPFGAIVAFSGKKTVDGIEEYTEESLNGFPSKDIEAKLRTEDYRLLVVANKYLTGFDEPLLYAQYIDKKLQGVLAVQTLSRLNRANKKLGKDNPLVLDFFNTVEDMKAAFDPFYTATSLTQPTDVNVLHELKDSLDDVGVYEWHEVEAFNDLFFAKADADQLSPLIDTAAARFAEELGLEDEDKIDFKIKAKQFVKIYSQVACLVPFNIIRWEKLYWFLKFLIPKLAVRNPEQDQLDDLLNSVDLSTYGLERTRLNHAIGLDDSAAEVDPQNPNPRGYREQEAQRDPLDEIIATFNQRFFDGWDATPAEQRVKFINLVRHIVRNADYQSQVVNNPDEQNRRLALEQLIKQAINQERRRELDLYRNYATDPDFERAINTILIQLITRLSASELDELLG
jgi:type I restriction enzyme R subunit